MSNKERYIAWAAKQEYMPIFMQPWWMDAVCAGKEWDVLLAEDEQGEIIGAMPYLLRKRAWFRYIIMPQQTQIGGIWVTEQITADRWKTAEVCRALKEQLDGLNLAYYYQQYMPGSLCVDAMRGLGFKTKERVTYRVDDLSDLDSLIASFSKNKRRQLQKALSLHEDPLQPGVPPGAGPQGATQPTMRDHQGLQRRRTGLCSSLPRLGQEPDVLPHSGL